MGKILLKTEILEEQEQFVLNALKDLVESASENGDIFDKTRQMRAIEGFNLLFRELGSLPQGDLLAREMIEVGEAYLPAYKAFINECAQGIQEGDKPQEKILSIGSHLKLSDDLFLALYTLGTKTFEAGILDDAGKMFQALAQINSTNFEPWYALGNCDKELGYLDYAINDFSLACLYDPHHIPSFLQLYSCFKETNQLEEADYTLKLAEELVKQNEEFDEIQKAHYLKMIELIRET